MYILGIFAVSSGSYIDDTLVRLMTLVDEGQIESYIMGRGLAFIFAGLMLMSQYSIQ